MMYGSSRSNTNLKFLYEIYTQLRQSINTNALERTAFLSVYIVMVAIVVDQIVKNNLFSKNNLIIYAVFIGVTFVAIILMIKIDYMMYERNFLADQIVHKYRLKTYLESYPNYVKWMSIGFFIVLLMIVFLSISIYGLLTCLACSSILWRILLPSFLCIALIILYILHRYKVKKYVTRKRFF